MNDSDKERIERAACKDCGIDYPADEVKLEEDMPDILDRYHGLVYWMTEERKLCESELLTKQQTIDELTEWRKEAEGHLVEYGKFVSSARDTIDEQAKRIEELSKPKCKWNGNLDACGNETCWDLKECQGNPTIEESLQKELTLYKQIAEAQEKVIESFSNEPHGVKTGQWWKWDERHDRLISDLEKLKNQE